MATKKRLPRPSKGRNLSDKQKIRIAESVAEKYASGEYTLQSVLEAHGIKSRQTWYNWCNEIGQIGRIYDDAIREANENAVESALTMARAGFLQSLKGYVKTVSERSGEVRKVRGKEVWRPTRKVEREVYVRPSWRAIEFVLSNHDPNFSKAQKPTRDDIPLADWTDAEIIEEFKRLNDGE